MSRGLVLACVSVAVICLMAVATAGANAAGDANVASCEAFGPIEASPGFRSYLPDCRGLELVTPPYKGGQPVTSANSIDGYVAMSPDGLHVIGIDFAGFAGTGNLEQSTEFGAAYEMSRGAFGWSTEALPPPSSRWARSDFIGSSADLSRTLWQLPNQEPHEELAKVLSSEVYLRQGTGAQASWTPVGPEEPEPLPNDEQGALEFVGAADDLGALLFATPAVEPKYWSGDSTSPGAPSLYQYRGVGNTEPELVGIANEGVRGGIPRNAGAVLESQCGTTLGSTASRLSATGPGSAFNAVSHDGSVVFFSALHTGCGLAEPPATELYARVANGTASAHTLAISEPSASDCAACDVSEPAEATFEGASGDGSKVFFLSNQKLLAGASGQALYEFALNGAARQRVKLLASNVSGVSRISDDGRRVFFVSSESLPAAADPGLAAGHSVPVAGAPNMYVYDTTQAEYAFVAPLAEADTPLWGREDVRPIQAAPDGSFTVFLSAALLTPDDHATTPQLFEYDAAQQTLRRVSVGQQGTYPCPATAEVQAYNCDGNRNGATGPTLFSPRYQLQTHPVARSSRQAVAAGGAVVFTSPDALTPGAVNDRVLPTTGGEKYVENVYEFRSGNVYLISPGDEEAPLQTTEPSRLLGMSATESDVFFYAAGKLVPQDADTQSNWYDARVGGGIPPEVTQTCGEGTCQPPPSARLSSPLPGGTELSSGETLFPASVSKPSRTGRQAKLKQALKRCARKHDRIRRRACVKLAQRRFGAAHKSSTLATKGAHR